MRSCMFFEHSFSSLNTAKLLLGIIVVGLSIIGLVIGDLPTPNPDNLGLRHLIQLGITSFASGMAFMDGRAV